MKLARARLDRAARRWHGAGYAALAPDARRSLRRRLRLRPAGSAGLAAGFLTALLVVSTANAAVLLETAPAPLGRLPGLWLNLALCAVAALQAVAVLLALRGPADRTRRALEEGYGVALRAERDLRRLEDKLEALRTRELADLMAHQVELLQELRDRPRATAA